MAVFLYTCSSEFFFVAFPTLSLSVVLSCNVVAFFFWEGEGAHFHPVFFRNILQESLQPFSCFFEGFFSHSPLTTLHRKVEPRTYLKREEKRERKKKTSGSGRQARAPSTAGAYVLDVTLQQSATRREKELLIHFFFFSLSVRPTSFSLLYLSHLRDDSKRLRTLSRCNYRSHFFYLFCFFLCFLFVCSYFSFVLQFPYKG